MFPSSRSKIHRALAKHQHLSFFFTLSEEPAAATSFNVNAVAVKLPQFLTDNTRVWFAQAEAQFTIKGVTSNLTKFYYCVTALNKADTAQEGDLIEYPPEEEPYGSLKARLTELHTLTRSHPP